MVEKVAKKKVAKPRVAKSTKTKKPAGIKSGFAVFATGGKQYNVALGDSIKIEKLQGEHKEGETLTFDDVLLLVNDKHEATFGNPFIKGAEVKGTLTKIARYKTVDVIKYKQKSRYFKKYGHRQPYFEVKIESIG